jgi:ABC-2 type transport system permease protein
MDILEKIKELSGYRYMLYNLVRGDLIGRYKRSVLGFLWTFINPLLNITVYWVAFQLVWRNDIDKYYLYLAIGIIPWHFFSACMTSGTECVVRESGLLKKIYFPREIIPIAFVTSGFVNLLFSFIILFVVVIIAGVPLHPVGLLCLPIVLIVQYLLVIGVTFITSAAGVYFRDLRHILGNIMILGMWVSPIFWRWERMPDHYRSILLVINPMASIILAYKDIFYFGRIPALATLLNALVMGVVFLIIGVTVFNKLKNNFAEEL